MRNKKNEKLKKNGKKVFYWEDPCVLELLKNSIRNNAACVTSTDTTLGLTANLTKAGFEKLNDIKEKRSGRPYLILISSKDKLSNFIDMALLNLKVIDLIDKCWPGLVTIVFKAKNNLPSFLTSKNGTIALRCPNYKYLQKLLELFDGLFSTSANKSIDPAPKDINQINPEVMQKIEYLVIEEEKNNLIINTRQSILQAFPSTIIDVSSGEDVKVVRKGAYPIDELEKYYGSKFKRSER